MGHLSFNQSVQCECLLALLASALLAALQWTESVTLLQAVWRRLIYFLALGLAALSHEPIASGMKGSWLLLKRLPRLSPMVCTLPLSEPCDRPHT